MPVNHHLLRGSPVKLHEAPSPNARRVQVFLREKGIPAPPSVTVDIRGGENLTEAYLALNPFGRVPVLELDDGTCLAESVAICRYFEGLHPEPCLFGSEALEQATIEMWNRRAELNFMMPAAQAFRNLTGFFKDRETVSAEWGAIALETAGDGLARFDKALAWNAGTLNTEERPEPEGPDDRRARTRALRASDRAPPRRPLQGMV